MFGVVLLVSGADMIMLEDELFLTSKLEFAMLQTMKACFFPVKASDIVLGKPVPFDLYHLLPQRKKFLKFVFSGDEVEKAKAFK